MSRFREIAQELEECMCAECWGSGTQNDAESGDIFYNEWECPTCKGSGINPDYAISFDIEKA